MGMTTIFLEAARSQVNKGIYVWGGNGENLLVMGDPIAWIRRHETTKSNAEKAIAMYTRRVAQGVDPIRAFDCSGLVYWCNKQANVGYGDMTAHSFYKNCDPVETLSEGDLVFHHNGIKVVHVGIYNGNNTVIEAKGRDYGVVKTNYSERAKYWNRQGHLKKMVDPEPKSKVLVIGGSVYVREGDNKNTRMIGIAHHGDTFVLRGVAPTGWYEIDYKGKDGFISNREDLTKLI